jgi:hypothetical protein
MTAASVPGKRFLAPTLSAERPNFRLRPCVQSAAWTSVPVLLAASGSSTWRCPQRSRTCGSAHAFSPRPGAELAPS